MIELSAKTLEVINGALITASTLGNGDAGNTTIVADSVLVDGINDLSGVVSSISSSVESSAQGDGGSVNITASNLTIDQWQRRVAIEPN
ncbi:MAG: hypothetical protein AAGF01_32045 [Cyanobacteria bacterium P01_G01_bin.38]